MPTRPASRHRIRYQGFVSAPGILFSSTSRETPPPMPPKIARIRMPTIDHCWPR